MFSYRIEFLRLAAVGWDVVRGAVGWFGLGVAVLCVLLRAYQVRHVKRLCVILSDCVAGGVGMPFCLRWL
jgi:hypothetical protein